MQPHVLIALDIPMPSTIDSEVGDGERDRGEYEGKEDRAGPESNGKVGNGPNNGNDQNGDNKNGDDKNRDNYNDADETGSGNWPSSVVPFIFKKNSPNPSVKHHALIILPLIYQELEQETK